MTQVYALKITQSGIGPKGETVNLYIGALSLGKLREHAKVDYWSPDNDQGYQRPLVDRRLRDVAKYVRDEQGILPTSVLLATRPDDSVTIDFKPMDTSDGVGEWGLLSIPDGTVLWVVDGQHRFYGVNRAYEKDDAVQLESYPFPISIMEMVDQYDEMNHFNIINTRQRKMSTDIVDRHLVIRQEKEGLNLIAAGGRSERDYHTATATRIVDMLNEAQSPWYHQIAIPGVPGRDKGLVRQHAMVVSITPVLKDNWIKSQQPMEEHVLKVLTNYWNALAEVWPEAFQAPGDHRVQATVGIYSLHLVLPAIIQRCMAERDLSQGKMKDLMQSTGIQSSFWNKSLDNGGDPLTLGTGMASIRALAHYIIGELPSTSSQPVKL